MRIRHALRSLITSTPDLLRSSRDSAQSPLQVAYVPHHGTIPCLINPLTRPGKARPLPRPAPHRL